MPSGTRRLLQDAPVVPTRRGAAGLRLLVAAALTSLAQPLAAQDSVIPPPRDASLPVDSLSRPVGGLRPGDLLKVTVYRDQELSGEFLIDSRGYVQIPGLGNIHVAGLDPNEARNRLIAALRERGFQSPEIAVQALVRVSVLGEVRDPGLHPVEPGSSLLHVVTVAGGPTDRANLRSTRVVRDGRLFTVDLQSGLAGSAAGRVVLYSNDVVVIPRRTGLTRENIAFIFGGVSAVLSVVNLIYSLRRN